MSKVRRYRGIVRVTLEPAEQALLHSLVGQVVALLEPPLGTGSSRTGDELEAIVGMSSDAVDPPDDPALRRLLPDAYRDDDERAAEFRRFTDADLRAAKTTALGRILAEVSPTDTQQRIDLDDDAAVAWLHGLNDVRLTLGTRLDIGEDIAAERAALSPGDPRYNEIAIYDWLSWLQEMLVDAVAGD
jgi:hypothetical protein